MCGSWRISYISILVSNYSGIPLISECKGIVATKRAPRRGDETARWSSSPQYLWTLLSSGVHAFHVLDRGYADSSGPVILQRSWLKSWDVPKVGPRQGTLPARMTSLRLAPQPRTSSTLAADESHLKRFAIKSKAPKLARRSTIVSVSVLCAGIFSHIFTLGRSSQVSKEMLRLSRHRISHHIFLRRELCTW